MARTLKSKLGGLWSAVTAVHAMSDEEYLDDDLNPKYDLETTNSLLRDEYGFAGYESEEELAEDIKLVREILENGEY